jgi:hypothetical protein
MKQQLVTLGLLAGIMTISAGCGSKDKKSEQTPPSLPTDPEPKPSLYTIEVGDWSFLYSMPPEVFTLNDGANGPMADDLDGFIRVAETGEKIAVGGSFRHQSCKDLDGVINVGTIDLTLENPLRYGVSIQQSLRNGVYNFRLLAGFEYEGGKDCVSFTFHSKEPYTKEINFYAPSELRDAILLPLNSLAKKPQ